MRGAESCSRDRMIRRLRPSLCTGRGRCGTSVPAPRRRSHRANEDQATNSAVVHRDDNRAGHAREVTGEIGVDHVLCRHRFGEFVGVEHVAFDDAHAIVGDASQPARVPHSVSCAAVSSRDALRRARSSRLRRGSVLCSCRDSSRRDEPVLEPATRELSRRVMGECRTPRSRYGGASAAA